MHLFVKDTTFLRKTQVFFTKAKILPLTFSFANAIISSPSQLQKKKVEKGGELWESDLTGKSLPLRKFELT